MENGERAQSRMKALIKTSGRESWQNLVDPAIKIYIEKKNISQQREEKV